MWMDLPIKVIFRYHVPNAFLRIDAVVQAYVVSCVNFTASSSQVAHVGLAVTKIAALRPGRRGHYIFVRHIRRQGSGKKLIRCFWPGTGLQDQVVALAVLQFRMKNTLFSCSKPGPTAFYSHNRASRIPFPSGRRRVRNTFSHSGKIKNIYKFAICK